MCVCVLQTSAVLCSGGCALLAVSSLLAIITIFLPSGGCERRICTLAGYMQMASGQYRHQYTQQHAHNNTGYRQIVRGTVFSPISNNNL